MASASQVHPKRLRRHQKPREPLIFKGFPGLFCIKVERVLDPASGSQKQRGKYIDPFSQLSDQSTPVSNQLSATQIAPIDSTFPSKQILSKKDSNGQTRIQTPCDIRIRDQKVAGSNPVTSTIKSLQKRRRAFGRLFLYRPPSGEPADAQGATQRPEGCPPALFSF